MRMVWVRPSAVVCPRCADRRIAKLEAENAKLKEECSFLVSEVQKWLETALKAIGRLEQINDAFEEADPKFLDGMDTSDCVKLALAELAKERREWRKSLGDSAGGRKGVKR